MKSFKEKVAVITGAGSGMGRYLAVLLAKDGADVCVCDVNEETLNETVAMLRKYNVSVSSHLLDVCCTLGVSQTSYAQLCLHRYRTLR